MKRLVLLILLATSIIAAERRGRIEIVSADASAVTYRELQPDRVAADASSRVFHYKGCPLIASAMQWISPAAATLRGFAPHCPSLRKPSYETKTEKRIPRDAGTIAVFFLGNSLTYYNEIPSMTQALATREMRPLRVDSVTRSGVTLEQLWLDTDALKKLWLEHWDFVVLQGGAGAAHPLHNADDFNRYLSRFNDEVRKSGATPLYYLVARGDVASQSEFERASLEAARRLQMRVVPAGVAWHDLLRRGRFRRLDWDGSHPDAFGAYLVACTVYSTIYGKPAHRAPYDLRHLAKKDEAYDGALREQTIRAEDARAIQDAAWSAVQNVNKR